MEYERKQYAGELLVDKGDYDADGEVIAESENREDLLIN